MKLNEEQQIKRDWLLKWVADMIGEEVKMVEEGSALCGVLS